MYPVSLADFPFSSIAMHAMNGMLFSKGICGLIAQIVLGSCGMKGLAQCKMWVMMMVLKKAVFDHGLVLLTEWQVSHESRRVTGI